MEVSGRRQASSEDWDTGIICDPCLIDNVNENAQFYCTNCDVFLCDTCARNHRKSKASRQHQLLNKDEMPKKKISNVQDKFCAKHGDILIEYFCGKHDICCCSVCITLYHCQCGVKYIDDFAKELSSSQEYKLFLKQIMDIEKQVAGAKMKKQNNSIDIINCFRQVKADIQLFRSEINLKIDALEYELMLQAEQMKHEDLKAIETVDILYDKLLADMSEISSTLGLLDKCKQNHQLFIFAKKTRPQVKDYNDNARKISPENIVRRYAFSRNDDILNTLNSPRKLGSLEMENEVERRTKKREQTEKGLMKEDNPISAQLGIRRREEQKEEYTIQHKQKTMTIDTFKPTQNKEDTMTTDNLKPSQNKEKSMTTVTFKQTQNKEKTITTDIFKPTQNKEKTMTTDTFKPTQNKEKTMTTDTFKPTQNKEKTMTTDTFKPTQNKEKTMTTDTFKQTQNKEKTMTTDTFKPTQNKEKTVTTDPPFKPMQNKEKTMTTDTFKPTQAKFLKEINIKHNKDRQENWINGSVLMSSNLLAVADYNNAYIKVVDLRSDTIKCYIEIDDTPQDITCMDPGTLVVTCDTYLVFLRYGKKLSVVKKVPMEAGCRGITSIKGKLFVTFEGKHPSVKTLNDEGKVLQTFTHNDQGQKLFKCPLYITVNSNGHTMYVSDMNQNTVTSLSMDGKVCDIYKHDRLVGPAGLSLGDDDSIYVVGNYSHNIHQITTNCTHVRIVLEGKDGLRYPRIVLYNNTDKTLYVSNELLFDLLSVYKLE